MQQRGELIDLDTRPSAPWRNGNGKMRVVATEPHDSIDLDFGWSISVAEVSKNSPFSSFPGIDRCVALLTGHGMRLTSDAPHFDHRLDEPFRPFHFAGESPVVAELIDGPVTNLSVLVKRNLWRVTLATLADGRVEVAPGAATVIFCATGEVEAGPARGERLVLRSNQAALWRHNAPRIEVQSVSAASSAAAITLHRNS